MKYDKLIKDLRICACKIDEPCGTCSHNEAGDCYNELKCDAADAIEELTMKLHGDEAAIVGMKQQIERMVVNSGNKPKWIPVTERLPKVRQKVLFSYRGYITKQPRISIGWYNGKQWDSPFATEYDVTHWMQLPEPPKEDA